MVIQIIDFKSISNIIDLSLAVLLFLFCIFLSYKFKYSKFAILSEIAVFIAVILSWIFQLNFLFYITIISAALLMFIFVIYYLPNIRNYFKKFTKENMVDKKHVPNKIIDHQVLYQEILKTVSICSKNKIGALITFEKNDDLIPLTKNGTKINAPVSHELLTTIFYPGTRLHDGAVIIKDGMIYAASVYYTPTTKALTGKYGSRHRAALGISEISDSVTVVVSEETGRISFAENGELEVVSLDNFIRELEDKIQD